MKKVFTFIGTLTVLLAIGFGASYFAPQWFTNGIIIILQLFIFLLVGTNMSKNDTKKDNGQ